MIGSSADINRLRKELDEVSNQAAKEAELRQLCEEVTRLKAVVQVVEVDKQGLLQRTQELTTAIEYLKSTMAKSVDDCFSKLKLDLNATGNFYQPIQVF